jgi:hypothetical protein
LLSLSAMSAPQALLIVLEPRTVELFTQYVLEPRKREAAALNLAEAHSSEENVTHTVERAAGISARLDTVVRARSVAIESKLSEHAAEYGSVAWRELAWLGSTGGSSWHQGLGRSLGLLANPKHFVLERTPPELSHLVRALRHLLVSTAALAPRLAMPDWDAALPPWGGPRCASGCVPLDYMTWLLGLLTGDRWPLARLAQHFFGGRAAEQWRTTTLAAVSEARQRRAHLIEVDIGALRATRSTPPPAPEVPLKSDVRALCSPRVARVVA